MLLDKNNVIYLYEISDKSNAPRLKKNCIEMIKANWKNYLDDKEFKQKFLQQLQHIYYQSSHLITELDENLSQKSFLGYEKGLLQKLIQAL